MDIKPRTLKDMAKEQRRKKYQCYSNHNHKSLATMKQCIKNLLSNATSRKKKRVHRHRYIPAESRIYWEDYCEPCIRLICKCGKIKK
jgi:hypothetical protein